MFLIFAALLIPAVLIFTYNHGRPGKDSWSRFEKVFMPSNLIVAGLAAFLLGGNATVDAAPTSVQIENEEGEEITRLVPSKSQVRRLMIFPFNASAGDNDWLRTGMPMLLSNDMKQDMRISTTSPLNQLYRIRSHNYKYRDKLPFSVILDIAKKTKKDYFVTGDISKDGENYNLDLKVYDNFAHGEMFLEKTYSGTDIFKITDQVTTELNQNLFLKESDKDFGTYTDLPASDLISPNIDAFKTYVQAIEQAVVEEAYDGAYANAMKALSLDEKSAEINNLVAELVRSKGDLEQSQKYISEALKLSKQLPERQQFGIKKTYWFYQNDVDKVLALMNNWTTLYPLDYKPYSELIKFYEMTLQLGKAKKVAATAMENGLEDQVLGKMADICIKLENLDEAETHLKKYYETYPEIAKEDTRLAEVYSKRGDFSSALGLYEQKLLDDPENSDLYVDMAMTFLSAGELDKVDSHFEKALRFAKQAPDSAQVYRKQMEGAVSLGKTNHFIECSEKWKNSLRKYMPELAVTQNTLVMAGIYSMAGASDELRTYYVKVKAENPQFTPILECIENVVLQLFTEDVLAAKAHYSGNCKTIMLQGTADMDFLVRGFFASAEGNHQESVDLINEYISKTGQTGKDFGYVLAKEHRLLGQPEKSIEECEAYLKTNPYSTIFLYELAMAQIATGNTEAANKTYDKLDTMWSEMDPRFTYYDNYKKLGATLNRN